MEFQRLLRVWRGPREMVWLSRASGLGGIFKNSLKIKILWHPAFASCCAVILSGWEDFLSYAMARTRFCLKNCFSFVRYLQKFVEAALPRR